MNKMIVPLIAPVFEKRMAQQVENLTQVQQQRMPQLQIWTLARAR